MEPTSGTPLDRARHATMQLNPAGNRANLSAEYMAQLAALPERERRRFMEGEYQHAVDGALWRMEDFARAAAIAPPRAAPLPRTCGGLWWRWTRRAVRGRKTCDRTRSALWSAVWMPPGRAMSWLTCHAVTARRAGRARHCRRRRTGGGAYCGRAEFGGALVEATLRGLNPNAALTMVSASRARPPAPSRWPRCMNRGG
ncbi:hypothetical protein RAA17_14270 [Komagataeibacter rhaeticus]|nr:hypothetical protein [Komagataeibacter rhaeticus]